MKNILIIVVGLIIVAAAGFGLTQLFDNDDAANDQAQQQSTGQGDGTATEPPTADPSKAGGEYLDIRKVAIADANNDEVFLFFHAPWCPQCRSVESGINSDGVPEGVTIIKVDYDTNQELRAKYGVTLQTTFVKVTKGGELIDKFVAYNDPQFSSVVRDFINKE